MAFCDEQVVPPGDTLESGFWLNVVTVKLCSLQHEKYNDLVLPTAEIYSQCKVVYHMLSPYPEYSARIHPEPALVNGLEMSFSR